MSRRLLISFSGGETSAYMTWLILTQYRHLYDVIVIVFANTGQENEETLVFVDMCDQFLFRPLGYCVTYLEAVQQHGKRAKAKHRVVSFKTANRDGAVFEDMISKYGIPNQKFPHCTRDLKLAPIRSFANEMLCWPQGSYDTAIGIRSDEIDRMSEDASNSRIVYPLIQWVKRTKPQINWFWINQAFRLHLKGYQGNCKWCWKKSKRKLFTLIKESPQIFDFPRRMEAKYAYAGPEFRKPLQQVIDFILNGYRRTFFRQARTVDMLFAEYDTVKDTFTPADDDSVVYDSELDQAGGCGDSESCEVFSDEMLATFEDE